MIRGFYRLYANCSPEFLHSSFRLPNCLHELYHNHHGDIVCLQEVSEQWFLSGIKPLLQAKGYWCFHKTKVNLTNTILLDNAFHLTLNLNMC